MNDIFGTNFNKLTVGESFVVLVSPLLFESGRYLSTLKKTIVVNW